MSTFRGRVLASVFVLHFVAELLLAPLANSYDHRPYWPAALAFVAILLTQSTCLGMWVGMGRAGLVWRLFGGLFAILLLSEFGRVVVGIDRALWYLFPTFGAVAIYLWLPRMAGYQLVDLSKASSLTHNGQGQFQIQHVLVMTIFVAVVISIGKNIVSPGYELFMVIVVNGAQTVVGLAAIWASLGAGSPAVRIPIVLVVACVIGWAMTFLFPPSPWWFEHFWHSIHLAAFALILSLTLLVFRWCGFRILHSDVNITAETQ